MMKMLIFASLWVVLYGCGGSSSSSGTTLNVPSLPLPPVAQLELADEYVGLFIGSTPLGTNPNLATSQQYSQLLYTLDTDNNITPVTFLDQDSLPIDLTGNVSFTDEENIIPLDIMVMSPDYVMLTIFHRDLDTDPENDYYNLFVDLRSGNVVSAPVGLNLEGNSGRSSLTQLGRDYFPPDQRWNDTEDLYVISVDYEALNLLEEVALDDHEELVDHHLGVPCPVSEDEDTAEADETDGADETDNTNPAPAADDTPPTDVAEDTSDAAEEDTTTQDVSPTCTAPIGGTLSSEDATAESTDTDATTPETTNEATANLMAHTATFQQLASENEAPTPTSIYKMSLGEANQYSLEQVSLEDDRPGLGQFVVSRSGIMIYRNLDGGDNSYRVLLSDCENVTGRVSTVLLAPYTSLVVADDEAGNSSIFEITERGTNKLIFSCNGNVVREAYSGYSERISSLRLPFNSESISSYDFIYPYFVNSSCQSGRLFPRQAEEIDILNPMPSIPGLPSSDPRGLRKSQMFDGKLYCIGYDAGLLLSIAELNPTVSPDEYRFLDFDFGTWLPDFDTLHVLSNNHVIFSGSSRTSFDVRTIMLNTVGEEFDLTDQLLALKVAQQIEITPPQGTTYSSTLDEE